MLKQILSDFFGFRLYFYLHLQCETSYLKKQTNKKKTLKLPNKEENIVLRISFILFHIYTSSLTICSKFTWRSEHTNTILLLTRLKLGEDIWQILKASLKQEGTNDFLVKMKTKQQQKTLYAFMEKMPSFIIVFSIFTKSITRFTNHSLEENKISNHLWVKTKLKILLS